MINLEELAGFIEDWRTPERVVSELYMQMWAMQMQLTSLIYLRRSPDLTFFRQKALALRDPETGLFKNMELSRPDIAATHFALSILDQTDGMRLLPYPKKTISSLYELLTDREGFMNDGFTRETDSRITFYAVCALYRLTRLLDEQIDEGTAQKVADFIISTFNSDGGAGALPGCESHAMQIYVGLGTLKLLGRELPEDIAFEAKMYLLSCYTATGGYCGRPNKLPDACYAMWAGAALELLGVKDYGYTALLEFIEACYDEQTGGIADRPETAPDLFHSHYCFAWCCAARLVPGMDQRDLVLDAVLAGK